MIALENGLERKKIIYNSYSGLENYIYYMSLEHVLLYKWWHLDVESSPIGWHKMSITWE